MIKVLIVDGPGDYAAVDFENTFYGQAVSDLIKKVENKEPLEGESGELQARVINLPTTMGFSDELEYFIRNNIQDYEHSKHCNFYVEGKIIGNR